MIEVRCKGIDLGGRRSKIGTAFPKFESFRSVEEGPASILKFPENTEFNREFFGFRADSVIFVSNHEAISMGCRPIP
jgi:hypothetical protein